MKAFVLGAGLGTRLLPLTEWLPKPLIPVFHRPLISFAFDHLISTGKIKGFVVNTHHCPDAYHDAFPEGSYRKLPVEFRHEPVLLETAGGIANVADLLGKKAFAVYNGDILTDLPLDPLWESHQRSGNEVTLLLRTNGPGLHISRRKGSDRVEDIRGMLGNTVDEHFQFSGIYLVEPAFLQRLTPGKKESVIPIFLKMIQEGAALGTCVVDEGFWWDLGDETTYRRVHTSILETGFPRYDRQQIWAARHPLAKIGPDVQFDRASCVGPEAEVGARCQITGSLIWPGACVLPGSVISDRVVRGDYETHRKHFF